MADRDAKLVLEQALAELRSDRLQEAVRACYQCGTCTGGCPVAWVRPDYNPRRIMETLLLGDGHQSLPAAAIWLCTYCHACLERCPQGLEVSQIIMRLKNALARAGMVPPDLMKELEAVEKTGLTVGYSSATVRRRSELGLPPATPDFGLAETRKIMAITAGALLSQSRATKGDDNV